MSLEKPPLATVEPGRPITAQGWNEIVDALSALYDAVLAIGDGTLEVSVQADGRVVDGVEVIAEPLGEGQPVEALPLFGTRSTYLVAGVTDGAWRVHVSAPGFVGQTVDVTVPSASPVTVNLAPAGVRVPDLFGQSLLSALATMRAAGLDADIVLDSMGEEISRSQVPAEYQDQPILTQLPPAGTVVDAAAVRLRLLVAAAVRNDPVVTMPSLIGLTQTEAARALEKLGLRVGKVTIRS